MRADKEMQCKEFRMNPGAGEGSLVAWLTGMDYTLMVGAGLSEEFINS